MNLYPFTKSRKKDAEKIIAVAEKQEPKVKTSFMVAVAQMKDDIDMEVLQEAIEAKNIAAAIKASKVDDLPKLLNGIGIDNGELVFSDEIIEAYQKGAVTAISFLPKGKQSAISYSPLGDRSIQFLRTSGAVLVREITDSTRKGVNEVVVRGFNEGLSPRRQAREIRQLVGLTQSQSKAVINFRQQLEQGKNNPIDPLTGQPQSMSQAASRRLSGPEQSAVRGHMKNGTFDQAKIDQVVNRYQESLQNKRANDIARTEALNAVNNGQLELWQQGIDQGVLDPKTTRKFWLVTRDDKLRPSHAAIPVMNPKGVPIAAFFATPFGPVMSPGDNNTDLINCRCVLAIDGV